MVLVAMLCSCHNRTQNPENAGSANTEERTSERLDETCITYATEYDTVRHAKLKYFDFDGIDDLTGYFHTLAAEYPIANWHGEECDVNTTAMECIAAVDAYRKGERRFYPYSLVRECIGSMGFNIAAVNNHGTDLTDLALAEWVMMCAAYYSPDITCLVETQTPDHHAGFYNFGEAYNPGPWWAYLFVKREKGYEVVGLGDFVKVRSIFQLADNQNRTYYLCANNYGGAEFGQWLIWAKGADDYVRVAELHDAPQRGDDAEDERYYFDKTKLAWKYAMEDASGRLVATDDAPALRLTLDGVNSKFVEIR